MAAQAEQGDRLPVDCGVNSSGGKFVLAYRIGKNVNKKDIKWEWHEEGGKYVAKLEARTSQGDIKYHNSDPLDADTYSKLGKPEKSVDGDYFKVKLKKVSSDVPDLAKFFDVPQ